MVAVTNPSMGHISGAYRQHALKLSTLTLLLGPEKLRTQPGGASASPISDALHQQARSEVAPSAFAGLLAWARPPVRTRNQRVRRGGLDKQANPNNRTSGQESETSHA